MAIIFELWVECESEAQSEKHISHFEGLKFTLLSGLNVSWKTRIERTYSGTAGIEVWSPQLSNFGIVTVQDAIEMSECGIRLYHHLLSAPDFQFAYIAFNPSICVAEIGDYLSLMADGSRSCSFSCVLNDKLVQQIGPLNFFQPFRSGYLWTDYQGESYYPLGSGDHRELLLLKQQLLAAR